MVGLLMGLIGKRSLHNIAGIVAFVLPILVSVLSGLAEITGGVPTNASGLGVRVAGYFAILGIMSYFIARYVAYITHRARNRSVT